MKVSHAEFITSAVRPDQYPAGHRPEIAFVGRSNVGKSTLLNILLNRRGLAKTSKKPGKTRLINFFDVNGTVHFVDLPGYGFAKVSKRNAWRGSVRSPSTSPGATPAPRDAPGRCPSQTQRRRPYPLDMLDEARVPALIVATKADKPRARPPPRAQPDPPGTRTRGRRPGRFLPAETREGVASSGKSSTTASAGRSARGRFRYRSYASCRSHWVSRVFNHDSGHQGPLPPATKIPKIYLRPLPCTRTGLHSNRLHKHA